MEDKYYIIDKNDKEIGPLTFEELKKMHLHPNTPVLKYGPNNWQRAADIKGLLKKNRREKIKDISLLIALLSAATIGILLLFWISAQALN